MGTEGEFPGKVRKLLYWPLGSNSLVVAEKERLSMWDMETKTRSHNLQLPSSMLELSSLQIGGKPYLVVLCVNGMHYFFRNTGTAQENLCRDTSYEVLAHTELEDNPADYGVLTALNNLIASSVGTGIYMREVANQGHSYNFIDISKISGSGLTNGIITALQLVSRSRLIIASSRLKWIFVVDTATERLIQSVTLDCHPCYVSYSQGTDLLLINDPLVGTRFFKVSSMSLLDIPKIDIYRKAPDPLTPVYVGFCESGRFAIMTENQSLFLHDVWNGSLVYSVDVHCVRLFSVALVLDYTSNIRIFAAFRPGHSKTWAIRSWDIVCSGPTIQISACQANPMHRSCLTCFQDALLNPGGTSLVTGCRFINFRLFQPSNPSTPECFRSSLSPLLSARKAWYELLEYNPWLPIPNEKHLAVLKLAVANSLQLSFEAELKHVQHNHLHTRNLLSDVYSTCDICYTALFFGVWYCAYCGFEVCTPCYSAMVSARERPSSLSPCPIAHAQSWVFPVSYFTEWQIRGILVDLKTIVPATTDISDHAVPVQFPLEEDSGIDDRHHAILRYKLCELTEENFIGLWVQRTPFIVNEAAGLRVNPSQLFDLAMDEECVFKHFDGFLWHATKATIKDYFQEWQQGHAWPRHLRVYPSEDAAQQFEHFLQRVSPQYLSSQGPLNLISHLPKNHIAPNLGPLLGASERDSMSTGSQFLQVSFTGKVDVLLHSQAMTSDAKKGARWDIWPRSSIPLLCKLLDPNAPLSDCELGGPLSRASYYLGKDRLADAAAAGAIPWTCILNPGDALFIPSGCPHQVSNLSNCINLTKSVLPITDVPFLQDLQPMLRHGNISSKKLKHKDQVRLDVLLWYTWLSTTRRE